MMFPENMILRLKADWAVPRHAVHHGVFCPFRLRCEFDVPATAEQIDQVGVNIPESLRMFWLHAGSAALFEDVDYGQWGLRILSPSESLKATTEYLQSRQHDAVAGDQVIGEFLGDSDLVVLRCEKSADDFGMVLVALPIDSRSDWARAASNFEEFLQRYVESDGDKFWEPH